MANTRPVVTVNNQTLIVDRWGQVSNWLTYSDANGNPAVQYMFYDAGAAAGSAYFWTPDNTQHAADTSFVVNASDLASVWVHAADTPGSDQLWVTAYDGMDWNAWQAFTLTTVANSPPAATAGDHNLAINHWIQLKAWNWIAYSDANGDPAVQYEFSDGGTGVNSAYFYTPDTPQHPANADFIVNAADLANVWLRAGAVTGADTMWVRASDGTDWGAWDSFNIITVVNSAPTISISTQVVKQNHWSQLAFTYVDAQGDPAVQYQLQDNNSAAGSAYLWTPDNAQVPAGTPFTVNAADISKVWIKGGTPFASETMQIRAFDGYDWGSWYSFSINNQPQNPPTVTIDDFSLPQNVWFSVAGLIHYSDAEGDPAVQYRFYDGSAASSSDYFWTPDNPHQPANTWITVNAADIFKVWFRSGTDLDTEVMQVEGFDGTSWSTSDPFAVQTTQQNLPIATINDQSLRLNQWGQVATWISYADAPQNHAAVQYQFTDNGSAANSAYFWTSDNPHQPANTTFTVNASDLGNVWIKGGSATGMDLMTVRVFDGVNWSNPDQFTLTTTM